MAKEFDFADLRGPWPPLSDDDRERIRRAEPWFSFWPQIGDDVAEALLRQILALRRRRLRSETAGVREEIEAMHLVAQLAEGVAGWAATRHMRLSHPAKVIFRSTIEPTLVRMLAAESLKLPLPLMPAQARRELARALNQLYEATVDPILAPSIGGGRGRHRGWRAEIELDLICWVEWQVAKKQRRSVQALDKVAEACGLGSAQAIRNWKNRLLKSSGHVAARLENARKIGCMEAAGQDPIADPATATQAKRLRSLDLKKLGTAYKSASQSRTPSPNRRKTRAT